MTVKSTTMIRFSSEKNNKTDHFVLRGAATLLCVVCGELPMVKTTGLEVDETKDRE